MKEERNIKVSKDWLRPMQQGLKPYDIRIGVRGFEIGEIVRFEENETGNYFRARVLAVLRSWEAPDEWGWDVMPGFEVITIQDLTETICGCTHANMLSSGHLQCQSCGHPNNLHNFGKGCRVTHNPETNHYWRIEPDGDYSKYKRVMR